MTLDSENARLILNRYGEQLGYAIDKPERYGTVKKLR